MERLRDNRIKIVFLGGGNVATHLAKALSQKCDIVNVWSRNIEHSKSLALQLHDCVAVENIEDIVRDADIYIIATTDDSIASVAKRMPSVEGVVVHTSGSVSLSALNECDSKRGTGVFYPLQTFSKNRHLDTLDIPLLIEGDNEQTAEELINLGRLISDKVIVADSDKRRHIHLAAVFANNFTNFMWVMASEYLEDKVGLDFKILEPLLKETLQKAIDMNPRNAQTGPAARGDKQTIEAHLKMLPQEVAETYKFLSEKIIANNK
ncbi:MAG: DUF2520 domain-containing protein [Muribaculaceae bacterium]|nr:DUF2520 domain-containing protein [Muribaculaceae bacterium]